MILLALIYFVLAILGLALMCGDRAPMRARVVLIVLAPAVAFAVWQAARPPTGWPAHAHYSKTAQFQWAIIREPDQLTHDPGEIDLWLTPAGAVRPRAYRLPYTRQLHKQAEAAMRGVKGGQRIAVRRVAQRKGAYTSRARVVFYRLPPPQLPTKGHS